MNEESDSSSHSEDFLYRRERLPSIVVEPSEQSELEGGELRWPPRCPMSNNVEEEEEEESSSDHTVDVEHQEDMTMEEGYMDQRVLTFSSTSTTLCQALNYEDYEL